MKKSNKFMSVTCNTNTVPANYKGIYNVSRAAANLAKKYPEDEKVPAGPATYEEAISSAGFGKFNLLLLFFGAMPAGWVTIGSMNNISQIIPSLKCYFQLSLGQIGVLNASLYIGNILSPFLWGYVADTRGRRKLMMWTTLADAVLIIISAFSVNVEMLSTLKALSGFATTAPGPIVMSYLSECHANKYRSAVILILGVLMSCFHSILPLIAWGILPQNFYYVNSWQVYMILCAVPSLMTAISFMFFPETPRYLMNAGKHDEALAVFQKIYSINSGKAPEEYPIKQLLCENKQTKQSEEKKQFSQIVNDQWKQFRPMFYKPYLPRLLLANLMQIFLMLSVATLRTWLPEIVNLMDNFGSSSPVTLCHIIQDSQNRSSAKNLLNKTITEDCAQVQSSDDVYIKLALVGAVAVIMYLFVTLSTFVINKKVVLGCVLLISGSVGIALIWITDPIVILLTCALYTAQTGVALVTFLSIVVDIFPTNFRALTLSIVSTSGRLASILGNLIFPALLVAGCAPAFVYLGVCMLVCIVPILLLSNGEENED